MRRLFTALKHFHHNRNGFIIHRDSTPSKPYASWIACACACLALLALGTVTVGGDAFLAVRARLRASFRR